MSLVTFSSCQQVLSNDETNDLMHWPVLRLATESFLRRVHHVFFFNKALGALLFTNDDRVYALGYSIYCRLEVGSPKIHLNEPTEVVELRGKSVVRCATGDGFIMTLTSDGDLYGWGMNQCGQVGCGSLNRIIPEPVLVLRDITSVSCGPKHTAALHQDGSVWCWGANNKRQLGFSTLNRDCSKASVVDALKDRRVVQVECGLYVTVALTDQAQLYHWGTLGEFGTLVIASPLQISLPIDITPVSVTVDYKSNSTFVILSNDGGVYIANYEYHPFRALRFLNEYEYDSDDEQNIESYCFDWEKVDLDEPVQAVAKGHSTLCVKLQSGRVAFVTSAQTTLITRLTSMADACALYISILVMPGMTKLPSSLITPGLMQSISKFHNPFDYDLTLVGDKTKKVIYLDTKTTAQCSPYLAEKLFQGAWKGKHSVSFSGFFAAYFTFLRYVHTGTVGVIEPFWIRQLLNLAIKTNTVGLRDLCFHEFINHIPNGTQQVLQKDWIDNGVLSMVHFVQFTPKLEDDNNNNMDNKIWRRLATESLFTARQLLCNLQDISSETDSSLETDNFPESYLQWMVDFSDESSLKSLLGDLELGRVLSSYLATTLTSGNCLYRFRMALETEDDFLRLQVVCFVANLGYDQLISLLNSEEVERIKGDQMRTLFRLVSEWQNKPQFGDSTKRTVDHGTTGPAHKHHKKA